MVIGHGAEAISRLIEDYEYIWGFATATAEEAIQLKDAGIEKPVLILGLVLKSIPGTDQKMCA
ncbi:MAG: alanine racemase [Blautia obeum]